MDDGYVIPGLNEDYTLGGAKIFEWIAGVMMGLVIQEIFATNAARSMPVLILVVLGTTFSLAALRRHFPDEERGIRNHTMLSLGFSPPGIPTPAALQPYWSGCQMRREPSASHYHRLGLHEALDLGRRADDQVN